MKFLASYYHRGSWWSLEFFAEDWEDAETICRAHSLRLDGEYKGSVRLGSLARFICWFKNL